MLHLPTTLLPHMLATLGIAYTCSVCLPCLVADRETASAYLSVGSRPAGAFTGRIAGLPCSLMVDPKQNLLVRQSGTRLFATGLDPRRAQIKDIALADLDGDGTDELLLAVAVKPERGGVLIYAWDGRLSRYRQLAGFTEEDYFPFLIRAGDIDNDGASEVVLGLWASSMKDPRNYARKLHVFDFTENELVPQWFSERIFSDFRIVRLGDTNRILETRESANRWTVNIFSWHRFGFWLDERLFVTDQPVYLDDVDGRALIRNHAGRTVEVVAVNDRFEILPLHERSYDERK